MLEQKFPSSRTCRRHFQPIPTVGFPAESKTLDTSIGKSTSESLSYSTNREEFIEKLRIAEAESQAMSERAKDRYIILKKRRSAVSNLSVTSTLAPAASLTDQPPVKKRRVRGNIMLDGKKTACPFADCGKIMYWQNLEEHIGSVHCGITIYMSARKKKQLWRRNNIPYRECTKCHYVTNIKRNYNRHFETTWDPASWCGYRKRPRR